MYYRTHHSVAIRQKKHAKHQVAQVLLPSGMGAAASKALMVPIMQLLEKGKLSEAGCKRGPCTRLCTQPRRGQHRPCEMLASQSEDCTDEK
eukprot:1797400-Amphidinium_carterae.2